MCLTDGLLAVARAALIGGGHFGADRAVHESSDRSGERIAVRGDWFKVEVLFCRDRIKVPPARNGLMNRNGNNGRPDIW
jgi:hypothetical protein